MSSSAVSKPTKDKPVIVRVRRKAIQSRLEAFWLEISERPFKQPLFDFEKLSISGSSGKGENSSALLKHTNDDPVIVGVKRKATQSRLEAFRLEINERSLKLPLLDFERLSISDLSWKDKFGPETDERPFKRPLLDFENLSISDSSWKEKTKAKKVFVHHVATVTTSETTIDIVQSFLQRNVKKKRKGRRLVFKKKNRRDRHLSKARKKQEGWAKTVRFEQIWWTGKGNKEERHLKELHQMCHFYDIVRVDVEERSIDMQKGVSLEDLRLLSSYLPLLREFIPSVAAEIESDTHAYMSKKDDYLYDYYTVMDGLNMDDENASNPFPLIQVEDEIYYDGPDDSEYDSKDSNDETSAEEDEVKSEASTSKYSRDDEATAAAAAAADNDDDEEDWE